MVLRAVAAAMTKDYYDLATDFYEYGWGACFHFGVRFQGKLIKSLAA